MLIDQLDSVLAVKLALTALLVLVATGFAARFGAFIGAMIAAIPISVGPAYLFFAMENDDVFVAQSALTSIGINPLTVVFLLICAALVGRYGIVVALAAGMGSWFVDWAEGGRRCCAYSGGVDFDGRRGLCAAWWGHVLCSAR